MSQSEQRCASGQVKVTTEEATARDERVVACNTIRNDHDLLFKILCLLSWPIIVFGPLTKFSLFKKLPAELRCIIWRFACYKSAQFIPFFWDPYAGLYTDHYTDPYTGPQCDHTPSILLATSESRSEALRIYKAVKLPSSLQQSSLTKRPEIIYIHQSIDVAWVCKPRSRDPSDILEVAMLRQPESIPISTALVRLGVYITELMNAGIKRVCFDMGIWAHLLESGDCQLALEKLLGGFDIVIVDGDQVNGENAWQDHWKSRAGLVVDGFKPDPSEGFGIRTLLYHTLLDDDAKFHGLVKEKGWAVECEVLWSGALVPAEGP